MRETVRQGARFARGLRTFLKDSLSLEEARCAVEDAWRRRDERFLELLDSLVWEAPASPYRSLLAQAGLDRGDVAQLVQDGGLESTLEILVQRGVYVSYEEYTGAIPAVRGSATFHWAPTDFLNPAVAADYMGSTSGTRSRGTPVGKSFAHLRSVAAGDLLVRELWSALGSPSAVWFPVLPSSAGLNNVLRLGLTGTPPERWFSHIDPRTREISDTKRLANRVVPPLSRWLGTPLPRPEHVPLTASDVVIDWCIDALGRAGQAWLTTYPTSAVALARRAQARGVRLDGLLVRVGGEPLTEAKFDAIAAAGAVAVNGYAFAQMGRVAISCPRSAVGELHVLEHHVVLVSRQRTRLDGAPVDALCWTSLDRATPSVHLNLESDDYGRWWRDDTSCRCLLGQMGFRSRVADVRGISKVVTGGITLAGERLEHLAEVELPAHFGGGPGSYQFTEMDDAGTSRLVVRVAPEVGTIDERAVRSVITSSLRADDLGLLADEVWRGAAGLAIIREPPVPSRSGKVLVFEPLR